MESVPADPGGAPPAPPELRPANIDFVLRLGPLSAVQGDVAGLLGDALLNLLGMFYPVGIGKKANVVITELVTNVFENITIPTSNFELRLSIDTHRLRISVHNQVTEEQFNHVNARVQKLQSTVDAKKLLAQTIRERRPQRLKGGLGLIRLVAENRFALSAALESGTMTVSAEHSLEGNA